MFENREDPVRGWINFHIRRMKSPRRKWAENVTSMEERRKAYSNLVGKTEGKILAQMGGPC
jgi:hypothetical protein